MPRASSYADARGLNDALCSSMVVYTFCMCLQGAGVPAGDVDCHGVCRQGESR